MFSWKILLRLILASLILNSASSTSAQKVKRASALDLETFAIKFYEKFDDLNDRLDQMGNKTFNEQNIIANINHLINKLNDENAKKFEEKLKNIENNVKIIDGNVKNIEGNVNNIEGNVKNIEISLNKSEKCEEKLDKMESILLQLKNASDVRGGVTSLCACADKATAMPVNETKALNVCHTNPCVHGGRCLISSTGSKYKCECPNYTSGIHCENVECSAEKRCYRFKDTLYVVIEANLTWAEAKVKCEGLNMTLAMPKDEERTRFLWTQLKPIYNTYPYTYLWIGRERDAGMRQGQWKWVDGSALGEYTGGNKYMKLQTDALSGALFLGGDGSWMWSWGDATTEMYSICESCLFSN